jgi:uroporphyrinogen decarboxylase
MNGLERIMAALRGERTDQVPIMLHNFMMAAREAGFTQSQYRSDPKNIASAFIRAVEKYDYDGILVDIDTATLAHAVGVPAQYPDDEPALCAGGCLDDLSDVSELPQPAISNDRQIQIWLEAVHLLVQHFGNEVCIRGNCDQAPFSLAAMMRTPQAWMMDLLQEDKHDDVFALLEYCTDATSQFIRLMAGTGAHLTSNGDGAAGPNLVSPRIYREYALPYEKKVATEAHSVGLPYVLHICGNTTPILSDFLETGADGMELDYQTDVNQARDLLLQGKMCFVGNIDPSGVLALGTVDDVERETARLLTVFADTPGFILNAGCAIPPDTPPQNIKAMIRTARR